MCGRPARPRPATPARLAYHAPAAAGLPVVTTCYGSSPAGIAGRPPPGRRRTSTSSPATAAAAVRPPSGFAALAETVAELRAAKTAPVAVGFGVRTAVDVAAVHDLGADAAVVGTATVDRVERAGRRRDVVGDLHAFVRDLRPDTTAAITPQGATS